MAQETPCQELVYPRSSAFEGLIIDPTPPAESSSGRKHPPYDVFINHCGEDTKYIIANSIYDRLNATGLRIFLDKNALEIGDFSPRALEEAMAGAAIQIAIFSENYAQSPWCLAELTFMLQTTTTFIPIFYHVEPSSLRWASKGAYANAFENHGKKGRYKSEKLQSWKLALHRASFFTGEIINNQSDEEEVVMNVVKRVLKELKKDYLDVAKHRVGLDELEQEFHDRIAVQSAAGSIQIVGIHGMGGAGKTTFAKHLYNKQCSIFNKTSFLSDVREAATNNRLHEKQKELLKDLDLAITDFQHVDRGKEILKSRLRSVPVLIVLDDVDHTDQLDALLPQKEDLGHGSLIIVTTRELRVLKDGGISTRYKMRALNPAHAQQLFCWHAFGQPSPFLEFEGLVKSFINACDGLPLSLKVLGGLLCGEYNQNYWQSQLDKLSRIVPNDIKSRLQISYDALDEEEKEMFLDAACFFIGWTSSRAIAVWDGCGWNGFLGLQRLVNICLIEEERNVIRMHDHLRDLGREIANQHSPFRLWSKWQIIEIQPQQEAVRIRGIANAIGDNCYPRQRDIIINTNQGERSLPPASVGLKIFVGEGHFINEERGELSRELLCFRCSGFVHPNLQSWLSLKKLRILQLYDALKLEDLWERDADAPLQLRELVINNCRRLRGFPRSIGLLKSLEKISIVSWGPRSYDRLSHLSEEFCNLHSLEHLDLRSCSSLGSLPDSFGSLSSLKSLDLRSCSSLGSLPNSFGSLFSLKSLDLGSCSSLGSLPDSFGSLFFLKSLDLRSCSSLGSLPDSFGSLSSLKSLDLRSCSSLESLPDNFGSLSSLEKLDLNSCSSLVSLSNNFGNLSSLKNLDLRFCSSLTSLPNSFNNLCYLNELDLKFCPNNFDNLSSFRQLISYQWSYSVSFPHVLSIYFS